MIAKPSPRPAQLLKPESAAEMLDISPMELRGLRLSGRMPFVLLSPRKVRFRLSDIESYVASRVVNAFRA